MTGSSALALASGAYPVSPGALFGAFGLNLSAAPFCRRGFKRDPADPAAVRRGAVLVPAALGAIVGVGESRVKICLPKAWRG